MVHTLPGNVPRRNGQQVMMESEPQRFRVILVAFSVAFACVVIFSVVTTAKYLSNARASPPIRAVNS
jgi:hypothetical protein